MGSEAGISLPAVAARVLPGTVITTAYQYDNPGNLSRVTRAKGDATYERAVDYTYDGANRLRKEIQYPGWPVTTTTLLTEYTYDGNGNRQTLRFRCTGCSEQAFVTEGGRWPAEESQ